MAEENIIDIEESAASLEDVKNTEQEDGSFTRPLGELPELES